MTYIQAFLVTMVQEFLVVVGLVGVVEEWKDVVVLKEEKYVSEVMA